MYHYPFNQNNPFHIFSSGHNKYTYCDAIIVCEDKSYSRVLGELFDTASDAGIQHMLVAGCETQAVWGHTELYLQWTS